MLEYRYYYVLFSNVSNSLVVPEYYLYYSTTNISSVLAYYKLLHHSHDLYVIVSGIANKIGQKLFVSLKYVMLYGHVENFTLDDNIKCVSVSGIFNEC
jgi:hypothetical protein